MNSMMQLVTKPMSDANEEEAHEGKLTVWRTEGPLDDLALELAAELTASGERLVVVDAAGCFDPSKVSRAAVTVAKNLHVVRAAHSGDLLTILDGCALSLRATALTLLADLHSLGSSPGPAVHSAQQKTQARRILIAGMLDHLYGHDMLTREAARALGRMKLVLEALTRSGLEVVVVCKVDQADLGARTYLLSSLCASAHEVHHWQRGGPLTAQHYVNGASAAIA